jgi:hypothetical protein
LFGRRVVESPGVGLALDFDGDMHGWGFVFNNFVFVTISA